jgi:hypothetical protein
MYKSYQWHVTQLTPEAAEKHYRLAYNVPDHVLLGHTPYNYLVTRSAVSQWACYTEEEFLRNMKRYHLTLVEWSEWHNGIRSAWLEPIGEEKHGEA